MTNTKIESIISLLTSSPKPFNEISNFSDQPGIYAFYYTGVTQTINSIPFSEESLLYIGKTESSQKKRDANTHFSSGKTGSSTVRRSLGAILISDLELKPIPRNATDYERGRYNFYKFDDRSEELLTEWMKNNIALSYYEHKGTIEELRAIEASIIQELIPTLNIEYNHRNEYLNILKALRKSCASKARGLEAVAQTPKRTQGKKPMLNKPKGVGKYSDYWEMILPQLREKLEAGSFPQQIQLSKSEFDKRGNRSRYTFNIQYRDGKVVNNLGGSAVARDLAAEIKADMAIRSLLKTGSYKINMDSNFKLWIQQI